MDEKKQMEIAKLLLLGNVAKHDVQLFQEMQQEVGRMQALFAQRPDTLAGRLARFIVMCDLVVQVEDEADKLAKEVPW